MPFNKPEFDDDIETRPAKGGLAAFVPFEPPRQREVRGCFGCLGVHGFGVGGSKV